MKQGISFVPQGRRLFTHLTIEENLEMGCPYLRDKAEQRRRMDTVMELFPILHGISGGTRRARCQAGSSRCWRLGRGLMANPEVLLLDEPTFGLAPNIVASVFFMVSVIGEQLGTMIMVVEHNIKGRAGHRETGPTSSTTAASCSREHPNDVRETNILTEVFLGKVAPLEE